MSKPAFRINKIFTDIGNWNMSHYTQNYVIVFHCSFNADDPSCSPNS